MCEKSVNSVNPVNDDSEQRKRIHEIVDIVLDTNGFGRRKCETTGNLPTCFLWFCGHTATFEVQLHENGWEPGAPWTEFVFDVDGIITRNKIEALRYACAAALEGKEV